MRWAHSPWTVSTWCAGILVMATMGWVPSGHAQVTYNVFPAQGGAAERPAQPMQPGPRVTVVMQDSTVEYLVHEVLRQAGLRPVYVNGATLPAKRISVHLVSMNVMEALGVVLKGTGLTARLVADGGPVVIRANGQAVEARPQATGVITGRVTDSASGQGLGGASVKIEGTKLSAVTSDSGHFTLKEVPAGDQVLSVKLFGYRPSARTVTVVDSQRTTVRIVLVPVPTVLSGVVTTATGQQARYQVGNDITVLNADSILKIAPVSNLTDMLETRVPGLIVQHTSGIPGAPSRLRLRGVSSINESADPILIVDGIRVYADQSGSINAQNYQNNGNIYNTTSGGGSRVAGPIGSFAGPSALDQLDPNSIETIEVLKGPSATAIYGSDAANGVIVITTKHGHVGPTHWSLNLDRSRTTLPGNWPTNYYVFQHDIGPGISHIGVVSNVHNPALSTVEDSVVAFQALNDSRYSPLTGAAGRNQDASLTVSGGAGALTYSVTGTASSQSGYLHLPPIELQRFQAFHGFSAPTWMRTPDQYVTYGENSQLTVRVGRGGGTISLSDAIFRSAQQQSSLQSALDALSREYIDTTQLAAHPLFPNYYTRAQLNTTSFTNAVTLSDWAPWHVLPITATAGVNGQVQNNTSLLPRDYDLGQEDSLGEFNLSQGSNTDFTLNIGTTLPQRLVTTALGINVNTVTQSNFAATTIGLPIGVTTPSTFAYQDGNGPSYATANTATYGWYVQPTFNFGNRFFASPGFRLDGGSNSGSAGGGNGGSSGVLSLFPKLDFSWIALSRPPSNPLFGLTLLRPRLAIGIAGVEPGPGEQLSLLQPAQVTPITTGNGAPVDILQMQTLGNPKLVPERDREVEGGVDAQFWNQRFVVTLTGYNKRAYDAILSIPIAPSVLGTWTGSSEAVNIGTIQNTGVEATLSARLLDNRLVDWSVNANITKNNNKLVSLAAGLPPITVAQGAGGNYTARLTPGYPLFGWWAQPIVGYTDANRDGLIEPSEVRIGDSAVYVGAPQPNYELSVSTDIRLFNDRLTFSTAIDYQNGLTQDFSNENVDGLYANPHLPSGEQAAIAAQYQGSGIGFLQTVNTLRWQTLSVGYLVPSTVARFFRVPTLSVSLNGSNLGLRTNYRGKDPNSNAITIGNSTQDDGNVLPQPRIWQLRVSIGN